MRDTLPLVVVSSYSVLALKPLAVIRVALRATADSRLELVASLVAVGVVVDAGLLFGSTMLKELTVTPLDGLQNVTVDP